LETFAAQCEFVEHSSFARDRERTILNLPVKDIDAPILDVILDFAKLKHCFTHQCCFGHFVHEEQQDIESPVPLPAHDVGEVTYRIAYLALCIQKSEAGTRLREALSGITSIDRDYVQFGSPGWFRDRCPNSYALQVEPDRFQFQDQAVVPYPEALHIQRVRDLVFERVRSVLGDELREADTS
jgi:hypothetical protein